VGSLVRGRLHARRKMTKNVVARIDLDRAADGYVGVVGFAVDGGGVRGFGLVSGVLALVPDVAELVGIDGLGTGCLGDRAVLLVDGPWEMPRAWSRGAFAFQTLGAVVRQVQGAREFLEGNGWVRQ